MLSSVDRVSIRRVRDHFSSSGGRGYHTDSAGWTSAWVSDALPADRRDFSILRDIEISNKFGFVLPKWKMLRLVYGIILPIRSSRRGHGAISSMSTRLVNLIRRIFMLRVVAKS